MIFFVAAIIVHVAKVYIITQRTLFDPSSMLFLWTEWSENGEVLKSLLNSESATKTVVFLLDVTPIGTN